MFLTADELRQLTGRARSAAQIAALKRGGYRYTVNSLGRPIVLRAHVERRLDGARSGPDTRTSPDFEALHREA